MVKAIIFDLQGTLVENGVYPSPTRQVKNILRIDMPFSDFVMRFEKVMMVSNHKSLSEAFEKVCEEFGVQPKHFIIEKLVAMWNQNKLFSKIFNDTIPTLTELKKKKYHLILSSNMDPFSKDLVDRFKFKDYFDEIILSCDTGLVKNDEGFYDKVLEKYDASDILLVGDSLESDIATAKGLGMNSVLVDRHNKREYEPKIVTLEDLDRYLN
ncbi:MAG TPA: HAD family hydrolase [Alphaproteobacteria bacterium]|nr:HAD family hydrolase [Alphaproteobacteria bacterium]